MSVNAIQHGGDHYRSEYQHWDLTVDLELNYFQACASKYVTRHRKKNGRVDILKAKHFVEKMIELIEAGKMPEPRIAAPAKRREQNGLLNFFFKANDMGRYPSADRIAIAGIVLPTCLEDYVVAVEVLDELLAEYDSMPTGAYVDQGRDI